MIKVSVAMHEGMGGPHLFHVLVKSSDPEKRVSVLKVKADIVSLETWRRTHPHDFYLPREVAAFRLRSEIEGSDAIVLAHRVFGHHTQIQNAYWGNYAKDKKQVHLLVSEYTDAEKAGRVFSEVIASIKTNSVASKRLRKIEVEGNPVHALENKTHEYFYFQRGNRLVWLLPDGPVAQQSLEEVMRHIQLMGS